MSGAAAGSLASATSSRVDSASKHITPCKVHSDYMASLLEGEVSDPRHEMQNNKMRYCMHKDEMVVGLGRAQFDASLHQTSKRAYPAVITCLGRMQGVARRFLAFVNTLADVQEQRVYKRVLVAAIKGEKKRPDTSLIDNENRAVAMYDFFLDRKDTLQHSSVVVAQINNALSMYLVGISLGMAYAHPNSGDTVASVMIGGLRTVRNGHYAVHTNDLLMFYFDDEMPFFDAMGARLPPDSHDDTDLMEYILTGKELVSIKSDVSARMRARPSKEIQRHIHFNKQNGNFKTKGGKPEDTEKAHIFRIKPYLAASMSNECACQDKARVFGRAISNAQPFEMLDIQLSRQAI